MTFDSSVAARFSATLDIAINGRPAATQSLAPGTGHYHVELPVPAGALTAGEIRLDLHYAAAASTDPCRDKRLGGVALALDPDSFFALTAAAPRDAEGALALLPATLTLALPGGPLTTEEYRRILILGAALARRGHQLALRLATEADIVLSREATGITLEPRGAAAPRLIMQLGSDLAPVRKNAAAAFSFIPFAGEGGPREARPNAEWSIDLPLSDLPSQRRPSALAFSITPARDAPDIHHVAALYINGESAGRAELRPGSSGPVILPIAPGLLGLSNRITLQLSRIPATGCPDATAPLPVTLDPGSRLLIAAAPAQARQLYEIAGQAGNGLSLYLPADYFARPGSELPFLAALLKDYWEPETPLELHSLAEGPPLPRLAFIVLASDSPQGAVLPLRMEAPGIEIANRAGQKIVALTPKSGGFAMLTRIGDAQGLWIAPPRGHDFAWSGHSRFEHGDVALFDETGVLFWFNSLAPRGLAIRYADAAGLDTELWQGWPYGIAVIWILATLVALILLAARVVRR